MTSTSPQTFKERLAFQQTISEFPCASYQAESKFETILVKKTLICTKMKLYEQLDHFYMKGFALRLVLKQTHKRN